MKNPLQSLLKNSFFRSQEERPLKILFIGDDPRDEDLLKKLLSKQKDFAFEFQCVGQLQEAINELRRRSADIIFFDIPFDKKPSLEAISKLQEAAAGTPVVVLAATFDEALALEAIRRGAQDCLTKDKLDEKTLIHGIQCALERSRLQEKLYHATLELKAIFRAFPDLLFRIDERGTILDYYAGNVQDLYAPPEKFLGKKMQDILPPETGHLFKEAIRWVLDTNSVVNLEYPLLVPAGEKIFEARLSPLPHKQLVAIIRDITEQKKTEKKSRETEQYYRTIADLTYDWECWRKPDGSIHYISPSCERITGYSPQEFTANAHLMKEIILPEDRKIWDDHIVDQTCGPQEIQFRIRRKDGATRWVDHVCHPIRDEKGVFAGRRASNRDVTDRKQIEEALKESEKRYRGLVESQDDLIVRVDNEGRFTYVNDAYCKKFGKRREELLGKTFMPLVHEEDLPRTLEAMKGLEAPPYRITVEQRARGEQGWRWLLWEDCAIKDETGRTVEIQAVGRDITEQKEAQKALKESEERYRRMVNAVTTYTYSVKIVNGKVVSTTHNEECLAVTGYSPQDYADRVHLWHEMIHPGGLVNS